MDNLTIKLFSGPSDPPQVNNFITLGLKVLTRALLINTQGITTFCTP